MSALAEAIGKLRSARVPSRTGQSGRHTRGSWTIFFLGWRPWLPVLSRTAVLPQRTRDWPRCPPSWIRFATFCGPCGPTPRTGSRSTTALRPPLRRRLGLPRHPELRIERSRGALVPTVPGWSTPGRTASLSRGGGWPVPMDRATRNWPVGPSWSGQTNPLTRLRSSAPGNSGWLAAASSPTSPGTSRSGRGDSAEGTRRLGDEQGEQQRGLAGQGLRRRPVDRPALPSQRATGHRGSAARGGRSTGGSGQRPGDARRTCWLPSCWYSGHIGAI